MSKCKARPMPRREAPLAYPSRTRNPEGCDRAASDRKGSTSLAWTTAGGAVSAGGYGFCLRLGTSGLLGHVFGSAKNAGSEPGNCEVDIELLPMQTESVAKDFHLRQISIFGVR